MYAGYILPVPLAIGPMTHDVGPSSIYAHISILGGRGVAVSKHAQ